MENSIVPRPDSYTDDVDLIDKRIWFTPLHKKGVAYGACFLAVFQAKTGKLKSLMGIPKTARKKMFARQYYITLSEMHSNATAKRFGDAIFDGGAWTIECPQAILAYFDKNLDEFSPNESVWAFWVNDFSPSHAITFAEFVGGTQTELTQDMVDDARSKYLSKFDSMYTIRDDVEELLDFTVKMGYDICGTGDSLFASIRNCMGWQLSTKKQVEIQKQFVADSGSIIQKQQVVPAYISSAIRNSFLKSVSLIHYCSLFMSYARCLYFALLEYLEQTGSSNAGQAFLQAMERGVICKCPRLHRIAGRKEVEDGIDSAIHIYCMYLAFDAFSTISPGSYRFKKGLAYRDFREFSHEIPGVVHDTIRTFCTHILRLGILPFLCEGEQMAALFDGNEVNIVHIPR